MAKILRGVDRGHRGLTQKNRERLRPLDDPQNVRALLGIPAKLMDLAAHEHRPHAAALLAQTFPCGDDRGAGYFVGLICGCARPAALSTAMIWRKHSMPYSVNAVTPSLPRP